MVSEFHFFIISKFHFDVTSFAYYIKFWEVKLWITFALLESALIVCSWIYPAV